MLNGDFNMARDIVSEAVQQAEAMKEAAYENAKSVLVEAMSTNLKAAVTEAIDEQIEDADVEAVAETEDAMDEASIDERQKYGGNKGDESKSRRDFEEGEDVTEDEYTEDEDEEEIADDAYDVDDDAGDEEGEEDLEEMDIEEVIEIIEDEEDDDEDIDVDIDVDKDDEEDDDEEDDDDMDEDQKYGGNKGDESRSKRDFEAAIAENKSLKKQNARYEKALTFLKKRIDEVNLFNARLAAASDVMKAVTLTKEEKEQVVDHFDSCKNVNEVKRTFNVVVEAYTANDRVTKQRVDRPNVQSVISEETKSEGDAQFDRLAELAGLK